MRDQKHPSHPGTPLHKGVSRENVRDGVERSLYHLSDGIVSEILETDGLMPACIIIFNCLILKIVLG